MSFNLKGCQCSRCKAYLFDEDDIVFCPVCGAPHHRECYSALGHCALEEFHGTENQYSKEKELEKLSFTKKEEEEKEETPKNQANDFFQNASFYSFDFLGGVPKDYKLDDNVTADDAKKFVIANTHRYIPKFAVLNSKNKVSWNWAAFLFPCGWMLSRKMYKNGIIAGLLILISSIMAVPFNQQIMSVLPQESISYPEMFSRIYDILPNISIYVIILAFIGLILELGIRIFSALFSDYLYKNYTVSTIRKIKAESDDIEFDFRKKGGINPFMIFLGEMIIQFIGNFIISFI